MTWTLLGSCTPLHCLMYLMPYLALAASYSTCQYSYKVTSDHHRVNFSLFQQLKDHSITVAPNARAPKSKLEILSDVGGAEPFTDL